MSPKQTPRQLKVLGQLPFSLNVKMRGVGMAGLRSTLHSLWHLGLVASPRPWRETWHRTNLGDKELARRARRP